MWTWCVSRSRSAPVITSSPRKPWAFVLSLRLAVRIGAGPVSILRVPHPRPRQPTRKVLRRQRLPYIPTGEGWLYLAAIKDLATREIVGWSMADHLGAELACDALRMALQRRQPPPGLTHHSDRGVQYACKDYRAILARHGITRSMSRKGNCYDNAPMESFFGSLKSELVHRTSFPTREAARRAIFEYVETLWAGRAIG